jgi:hypothetical protein
MWGPRRRRAEPLLHGARRRGQRVEMVLVDAGGVVRLAAETLHAGGSGRINLRLPGGCVRVHNVR